MGPAILETTALEALLGPRFQVLREARRRRGRVGFLARDREAECDVRVQLVDLALAGVAQPARVVRALRPAHALEHAGVVPLSTALEGSGSLVLVRPRTTGISLRAWLAREGRLPVPETVRVLRDVAATLVHAHAEGVVHLALDPADVWWCGTHARVDGFGVLQALAAGGAFVAGPSRAPWSDKAYAAPEQAHDRSRVDERADLYALGVLAYELFTSSSGARAAGGGVPPGLQPLLGACLEPRRDRRRVTALEALGELSAFVAGHRNADHDAELARARLLAQDGDRERAVEVLEELVRADGHHAAAHAELAVLLVDEDPVAARLHLECAWAYDPALRSDERLVRVGARVETG